MIFILQKKHQTTAWMNNYYKVTETLRERMIGEMPRTSCGAWVAHENRKEYGLSEQRGEWQAAV